MLMAEKTSPTKTNSWWSD